MKRSKETDARTFIWYMFRNNRPPRLRRPSEDSVAIEDVSCRLTGASSMKRIGHASKNADGIVSGIRFSFFSDVGCALLNADLGQRHRGSSIRKTFTQHAGPSRATRFRFLRPKPAPSRKILVCLSGSRFPAAKATWVAFVADSFSVFVPRESGVQRWAPPTNALRYRF